MFGFALDSEHLFGHHGTMSRPRVRRRRVGIAAVVSVGLAFSLPAAAGAVRSDAGAMRPVVARQYVVVPGDTLWRIAVRADPGRDPRVVVDQIERENAVEPGSLQPGQVLVLPAAG
jgi:Tfp pilus assembly protein FimV